MALNPGDTLQDGRYEIERQLGRGGFGFVYQAQDTLLAETVAIKELIPALVGDEAMLKRFLSEARATMKLRHDHIVATYNVFRQDDHYYIIMECLASGSLEERLRGEGPLDIDNAIQIATQVCEGLGYAHGRGIVHCDLKPANILLDGRGNAKVADFGIAHVSGEMFTRQWHTQDGFFAGTLPYMSPEQADGVRDDPRVDVYALGAVLYRLLTGKAYLSFDQRETPGATADNVFRMRNEDPQPPSTHQAQVAEWLDGVVLKALAKDPEDRYSGTAEFQSALQRGPIVIDESPVTVIHSHLQTEPPKVQIPIEEVETRIRTEPKTESRQRKEIKKASGIPIWQQIGIEMINIPTGVFRFGEKKKKIHLPEYAMSKTPVTNAQYKAFVEATGHPTPKHWQGGSIPSGKELHPVVHVSWHDAVEFCEWACCRLPTEHQWEKGARGTDGRRYPWGGSWQADLCNTNMARTGDTTPVDTYLAGASPYGLLDMAGNVWEWTLSLYEQDPYDIKVGRQDASSEENAPRVLRGGSFDSYGMQEYCEYRFVEYSRSSNEGFGFRCVTDPVDAALDPIEHQADRLQVTVGITSETPIWQQIGIEMVAIPAGEFLYGEEKVRLHLPSYSLAKTPVTNAQYKAFMDATGHPAPRHWKGNRIPLDKEQHPVVQVSLPDAVAFCQWAGCRIPTEREWEKGARGVDGREYPWGEEWQGGHCNTAETGLVETMPVGAYTSGASPYGLLDMAGNISEWTLSLWQRNRYDSDDERVELTADDSSSRVVRGSAFDLGKGTARCVSRRGNGPPHGARRLGFRCAMDSAVSAGGSLKSREDSLQDDEDETVEDATRIRTEPRPRPEQLKESEEIPSEVPIWQQIGIEMVTIPAGEFLYGKEKKPIHLPEYMMAKTPVTNAQYKTFVEATGHPSPEHWQGRFIPSGKGQHPVVHVSWHDAVAFCAWAGCRLPTEKEWEKAARGDDGREYPWGEGWQAGRCNSMDASIKKTTPVEAYPSGASPYGLLDMAGNVLEWAADWYDNYDRSPDSNPLGPDSGEFKVLRGGSWSHESYYVRTAYRFNGYPTLRGYNFGFRCAADSP